MKRYFALVIALSFFLLSMPISVSAIADNSDDASFYLNYWVEEHTGINMKEIPVTAYGMSYADYIYRQTGCTIDYWVDNATNPSNFGDNTNEYLENTLYNDSELMKDLLSTTPITNTTSQVYGTNYNQRVNSDGDINVSGSNYWNSIYNGLSQNGYNDIYADVSDGSFNVSYNGQNISFSFAGVGDYNYYMNSPTPKPAPANMFVSAPALFEQFVERNGSKNFAVGQMYVNGQTYYFLIGSNNNYYYPYSDFNVYAEDQTRVHVSVKYDNIFYKDAIFIFNGAIGGVGSGGTQVQQPKQCGYVLKDGIKYSVYTDPSQNPFTINPDGTVSFPNDDNTYPIYIDPDELSPEGDQYMIQYIINNYYGNDYNDFDPFSGDPNNRLNYPDSNTKDYSQGINSVLSWLKKIYNKECDVVKYLKQIAKGLPLNDSNISDNENEDKFDTFESMLKLFNGKNNDGFKHKMLNKIGYAGITQNINNFGMALFGSRTFNDDGTVNTQFGANSITETPTLYYTYAGVTHNFWTDLQLINQNGDLTKAKEYVRFFIIFGFFLSLFRSLPSLINNAGGILSHASLAVPVDQSENSIELTEINQILADAPYPDEF